MSIPSGISQLPNMNPQQQQVLDQLLSILSGSGGQVQNYLQDLFSDDPEALERMFAPARREFQEQTVPGIAERFSGLGSGAQSSSAFAQDLSQAGSSLSEKLASMREGLRGQGLAAFQNLSAQGLGAQPFSYLQKQRKPGFWESLMGGASNFGGNILGNYLGKKFG